MNKLKVAVIGSGNMGKNHARIYSELGNVNFVAVADTNEQQAKSIASLYQVKPYESHQALIKAEHPDAVSICVPTAFHFAVAKDCIERGIHVLLEKPITMNVVDGEALLRAARERNILLFVGHIERYNPAVQRVKSMVDRGEIGNVTAIVARRVGGFPPQIRDVNIAVDLAIHDIDIVNYLLGELPKNVTSHKKKNHIEKREDSVEFFLEYSAASAYLQANWITPVKIRKLNITGSEGYLEMDYVNQQIEFYKSNYQKLRVETSDYTDYVLRFSEPDKITIAVAKQEPLRVEIETFIDLVQRGAVIDSQYAIDALRIALTPSRAYAPATPSAAPL